MEEPAILVVLIYIAIFFFGFAVAGFLIWRVMNKPGAHIGSRLPQQPAPPGNRHHHGIPLHPEDIPPGEDPGSQDPRS